MTGRLERPPSPIATTEVPCPPFALTIVAVLATTAACSGGGSGASSTDPDTTSRPALAACRLLTPDDTAQASNATTPVACSARHTAQTFAVGTFPARFRQAAYDASALGRYIFRTCGPAFTTFLGSDDSEVRRSLLSWAWFRASEQAWSKGARWYRCDVVGGPDDAPDNATSYAALPTRTKNLLGGAPVDTWMLCARGASVDGAKVPCSAAHDWRAVTTIKLGQPDDPYPGDRLVQIRSSEYCSDSVGAWLNYPAKDFRYGMTIYHEAEWKAGNRRTICWARTTT